MPSERRAKLLTVLYRDVRLDRRRRSGERWRADGWRTRTPSRSCREAKRAATWPTWPPPACAGKKKRLTRKELFVRPSGRAPFNLGCSPSATEMFSFSIMKMHTATNLTRACHTPTCAALFWVLFREWGILLFFHAGKMTTHCVKIPRFHCSYFRPCVPCLFVWARQAGFYFILYFNVPQSHAQFRMWKFCVFVAAISGVCVCYDACENSAFSLQLFPAYVCVCVCAMRQESCENSAFLLQLFPANVCVCVCYIACENSAFSLQLFPAYVFRVLFRERGIKAVFSHWDFWVPNHAKIPWICCGCCQPTVVRCCLFVFIWGFVHLFFATSMGIFLFCVVSCLGHCMHMCETLGRVWVNSTNLLQRLLLFICLCHVWPQPVLRELGHAIRSSGPLPQVEQWLGMPTIVTAVRLSWPCTVWERKIGEEKAK